MNQRDLELLSAYLDGQLKPSESIRLESRLNSDPQLASALTDLRASRNLLRKLPARKAPRNFTLTRKMVGQNPPLPRTYPIFRFATALATLLFIFSFGLNTVGRQMASQTSGIGGMGGGGGVEENAQSLAAPAATEAPFSEMAPAPTYIPPEVADAVGTAETQALKTEAGASADSLNQAEAQNEPQSPVPWVSSAWQIGLAVIALASALLMVLIRQISARRWK